MLAKDKNAQPLFHSSAASRLKACTGCGKYYVHLNGTYERARIWAWGNINGIPFWKGIDGKEEVREFELVWISGEPYYRLHCRLEDGTNAEAYRLPDEEEGEAYITLYFETEERAALWTLDTRQTGQKYLYLNVGREGRERPKAELILELFQTLYHNAPEAIRR